jgi:UDPglucose--hexose-1-phosphate uridylyltransferase
MPQYRQNFITKEWVVIAPERAKRPDQFNSGHEKKTERPEFDPECPFCPGNEKRTPPAIMTVGDHNGWKVRVVPNKFAAVSMDQTMERKRIGNLLVAEGYGIAEVIIESPRHNTSLALMTAEEVYDILSVYKKRYSKLAENENIDLITIFRNYGAKAGTSLEHPHSQIIATPIVPPTVRLPMQQALFYHDSYGSCPYCVTIEEELSHRQRIIIESQHFLCFAPFAAHVPYETMIIPKRHSSRFHNITEEEMGDLAGVLRTILRKLHFGLNDPDYNLMIRSSPNSDGELHYDHWRIIIVPRITTPAGFELGSGIYINIVKPEEGAAYLRDVNVE